METLKNIFTNKWTWIAVGILGFLFLMFYPMYNSNNACPPKGITTQDVKKVNLFAVLVEKISGCPRDKFINNCIKQGHANGYSGNDEQLKNKCEQDFNNS
jgi:hypothetical protein